jgi:alkylation response protein AidB-like acyl-CoA dehydrogenase
MDFSLTHEQELLRDSVRRFVADAHSFEQRKAAAAFGGGFSPAHWDLFAQLGWLGLPVSEAAGGFGGSIVDAALVAEELGRGLVAAPFLTTAVLCAGLIECCHEFPGWLETLERIVGGDLLVALACEEPQSRYQLSHVSTSARPEPDGVRLDGRKIVVLDGASADCFIVSARMFGERSDPRGIALYMVPRDATGLRIHDYQTIDGRRAADLQLDDVRLSAEAALAGPEEACGRLGDAIARAAVCGAADSLGAMDAAIAMTADYVKTRKQFGRALGSFQVVQHRLADMFVAAERARSMVYRALSMIDRPPQERDRAISAMAIAVAEAGAKVGQEAIQLHGGIGMTEDYPVGHYYKRLQVSARAFGDPSYHFARFAGADASLIVRETI